MNAKEYFEKLKQQVGTITPTKTTYFLLENVIQSLEISNDEDVIQFVQIIKDPLYDGLAVESFLACKGFIHDIIIGVESLRYNTVPLNSVRRIAFHTSSTKSDTPPIVLYSVQLQINYGSDQQVFHYNTSGEKFTELLSIKKQIIQLISK